MLEMWPYPSGTLHMGHTLVYTIGDVLSRFRRRNGLNVHARRWASTRSACRPRTPRSARASHPREIVERNITEITRDDEADGLGLRLEPPVSAHEPEYYRWTQWLFLKLFEAGLAYRKGAPVKWCPFDQVVLANEQVHDGSCEYCGTEVIAKNLEQWFFKTTAYADELLDDLAGDRLAGPHQGDAAQLDRPLRRRRGDLPHRGARGGRAGLHDAARHAVRRDVLRARAGASARREAGRALAERGRAARLRQARGASSAARSARPPTRRPASSPASSRRTRSTRRASRSGSPTTC